MDNSSKTPHPNQHLFDRFLREKQYLKNVSACTVRTYKEAWIAFLKHGSGLLVDADVKDWLMAMAEAGMSAGAINCYARGINSFLTWAHENGHTPEHLKAPYRRQEKRVLNTYTPEQVKRILSYKPKTKGDKRLMALLTLLVDTGCRIDEALSLRREDLSQDNFLLTLRGKGSKQRRVPISPLCRKAVTKWADSHSYDLVFCNRTGGKLLYDNTRDDFLRLLDAVGVPKSEGAFHALRRYFGKSYLRDGGNILYLQAIFGHTSLEMTRRYIEADVQDLQLAHKTLSPLERLKR